MSKLNINPLGDRIVVKPMEAEEKTKGGIILPDTAKEKPVEGSIMAAGPGRKSEDGKIKASRFHLWLNQITEPRLSSKIAAYWDRWVLPDSPRWRVAPRGVFDAEAPTWEHRPRFRDVVTQPSPIP